MTIIKSPDALSSLPPNLWAGLMLREKETGRTARVLQITREQILLSGIDHEIKAETVRETWEIVTE